MKKKEKKEDLGRLEALSKENDELRAEVAALRSSVGSYKSANTKLKARVEHYKALDREGDGLYENRIAEAESLRVALSAKKKVVEGKDKAIEGLNSQVAKLSQQVMSMKDLIARKDAEIQDLETAVEYEKMPWWKKVLMG